MKWLTRPEVENWLRQYGVSSATKIEEILRGFNFDKPIYEQIFDEGNEIFQFIRNVSATDLTPQAGNWFAPAGATTRGVAIIDGGSGRRLHKYRVTSRFAAIEGIAGPQNTNWSWAGGGMGGNTQIYIPRPLIGHLSAVAPQEHW